VRRFGLPWLVVLILPACQGSVGPTASGPTPSIFLTLVVGESLQVATVTIATPADSFLPREGVPASPASVDLRVEDGSGSVWPLSATATPGRFQLVMSPVRGVRYRLAGTVLGRGVASTTLVPSRFDLVSLPRDTITAADSVPCSYRGPFERLCFPMSTASDQLLSVECVVPREPNQPVEEGCFLGGDTLRLWLARRATARDILIVGYNSGVHRPVLGETVTAFGAALVIRRTAYLP